MEWLNFVFCGNRIEAYLYVLAVVAGAFAAIHIIRKRVIKRLKLLTEKTDTTIDDYIIRFIRRVIVPLLYIAVIYLSLRMLYLSSSVLWMMKAVGLTLVTIVLTRGVNDLITYFFSVYRRRSGMGETMEKSFGGILTVIHTLVWTAAAIFYLDNLGFRITTVIAGLGVGGVAVALAAQTVLKDLFSYLCILFDRPFEVGDFIIVGDFMGCVENIGIKTTRISSLGGEQLVFANADLTDSRVRNYKRMQKRRVVFNFGVVYQTSSEKLKEIPKMVAEIIKGIENTIFDRAHFQKYGDSSLDFEVVYYVLSGDYNKYMDIQQSINFAIFDKFEREGIDFAYPTRTLYMNQA